MAKWYERGEVGDAIRDVLDFYDNETCINKMEELGLNAEEIIDVLLTESLMNAEEVKW